MLVRRRVRALAWLVSVCATFGLGLMAGRFLEFRIWMDAQRAIPACGATQRMVILKLSPAAEAAIDSGRGDRWSVLEARPVPRGQR